MAAAAAKTAEGYDDSGGRGTDTFDDTIEKIRDRRAKVRMLKDYIRSSYEASQGWRTNAVESYRFVKGDQWTDADLALLRDQGRPALVLNKILAPVMFLLGLQRQQRSQVKLLPMEAGDVRGVEFMQGLLKWVGLNCNEQEVDSQVFQDKVITGRGFWKLGLDYRRDVAGQLRWWRVNPLAIFTDPNWPETPWEETKFVGHAMWYGLRDALDEWPDSADAIRDQYGEWMGQGGGFGSGALSSGADAGDPWADRRMFWDPESQRVRVMEIWYRVSKRVTVAHNAQTGQASSDPGDVAYARELLKTNPQGRDFITIVPRTVTQIRVAKLLNDTLLDDFESPYDEPDFPIFPDPGYYFWDEHQGVVEAMKDPQREKNKRRSSIIEIVRRMPHQGWWNKKNGGAKSKDIVDYANGAGVVVEYENDIPQQMQATDIPQALVYLERATDAEIKEIPNINNELIGQNNARTVSGRAIEARQRGGLTVQEPLLETHDNAKKDATRFMLRLIQQYVSLPQAMRVLGAIAQRAPQGPEATMMSQMAQSEADGGNDGTLELAGVLQGALDARYDVAMTDQPWEPSLKREQYDALLELVEKFGPQAFPPDVLAEAAQDAGILSEDKVQRILAYQQQQLAAAQQAQAASQRGLAAAAGQSATAPPMLQ